MIFNINGEVISQHHLLSFSSGSVQEDSGLLVLSKSMFSICIMLALMTEDCKSLSP